MRRAVSLSGAAFALLCIVLILLIVPAAAQNDGGIPPGTPANGVDTSNQDDPPDLIIVAAENCRVSPGSSITLEDGDGTQGTFTDGERGITISDQNGRPMIESNAGNFAGDHATFPSTDKSFDTDGDYSVVSSTGITGCSQTTGTSDGLGRENTMIADTISDKPLPNTGGLPFLLGGGGLSLLVVLLASRLYSRS